MWKILIIGEKSQSFYKYLCFKKTPRFTVPTEKKHPLENFAKNIQKKQNAMMNKVRDIYSKYSNFERLDGKEQNCEMLR